MYRKLGFKILVLSLMLFIPLLLGTTNGYGGSPPPFEADKRGKIIRGHVTLKAAHEDLCSRGVIATITGNCPGGKLKDAVLDLELSTALVFTVTEKSVLIDVGLIPAPEGCREGDYINIEVTNWDPGNYVRLDGCFGYTGQMVPTVIEYDVKAVFVE